MVYWFIAFNKPVKAFKTAVARVLLIMYPQGGSMGHKNIDKFLFKDVDVMSIANLCGEILDDCIEKGLYKYFGVGEE